MADRLGIRVERTEGKNVAQALATYAHAQQVTEIVIGHSGRKPVYKRITPSIVNTLIDLVDGIDVLVVATDSPSPGRR